MSYDGFYGGLSTRGSANEILNQAIQVKDEIKEMSDSVVDSIADIKDIDVQVTRQAQKVAANTLIVEQRAQEVQVNADYVGDVVSTGLMKDAPADGNTYARKDHEWVLSALTKEYLDVNLYYPTITELEPGTKAIARIYPRHKLSRAILPACFVHREVVNQAENLTLEITSTDPSKTWKAVCVIPAGQKDGFFTSGAEMGMGANEGFVIKPNPEPGYVVNGLSISLRWEILPDQTFSMRSVKQPDAIDTVILFGESVGATFTLDKISTGLKMHSQDQGGNVKDALDMSASKDAATVVFIRQDGAVVSADIRSGFTNATIPAGYPRRGINLSRDSTKLVLTEDRNGVIHLVEYNFPDLTIKKDLVLTGVEKVNSVRYAPNDRYIMVAHSKGLLLLNAITYLPTAITKPPVGEVLEAEVAPSVYALLCRQKNNLTLHIVNNGEPMAYLGDHKWAETTTSLFNWDAETDNPYPHFVVGGRSANGKWEVVPYKAQSFDYHEMDWKIDFGEEIVSVAFSEVDVTSGDPKESIFGRAIAVFGKTGYKVYSLQTGVEVAVKETPEYPVLTAGTWKEAQGVYA